MANAQCFDAASFQHVLVPGSGPGDELGGGNMANPVVADGDVVAISDWEQFGPEGAVVHIWRWQGSSWQFEQTLYPNLVDPNDSSYFGRVIDLDGDTLVVGDQFARVGLDQPVKFDGRIYVYEFDGQAWQLKTTLGPIDHGSENSNGFFTSFQSLAVDGDWIFGGKSDDQCPDVNNICWNDLFIYKRVNGIWQETPHQIIEDVVPASLLLDGNTATWDSGCLELQGDTWVMTSNCPELNGQYAAEMRDGVALIGGTVFRRISGTWQVDATFNGTGTLRLSDQQRILASSNSLFYEVWQHDGQSWALTGESFGMGVQVVFNDFASAGPHVVAGLYGTGLALAANMAETAGPLPVLDPEQVIENPTPEDYDFFGTHVAMGEDYAAIGISGESAAQTPAGSALVLKRSGETWVQDSVLMVPVQGFSYVGETIDITGNGNGTVIVLGGGGYCAPQGMIANPGQAFAVMRSQNTNSGWVIEELVPLDPVECNDPWVVHDGINMSVKATGSGEDSVIAVGYPGEDGGLGAVEIFRRDSGQWVNSATITDPSGSPGDYLGQRMSLVTKALSGDLLLVLTKTSGKSRKILSSDGGVTWDWMDGQPNWSNLGYGLVFDMVVMPPYEYLVSDTKVIRVDSRFGYNDDTLIQFDSGLDFVSIVDAVPGPNKTITAAFGSNDNVTSPIKILQLRPEIGSTGCVREVNVSNSNLTAKDGLGTSLAVGLKGSTPVLLAGGAMAEGENNGNPVQCGRAVMTLPATPLAPPMPGDVNGDGLIGVDDVLVVLDSWGSCSGKCLADFNGDGVVAVEDLLFVLRHWTQ
ncbi:MAG: hypothetical protein MK116_09280 [Phycisphaerales bacterium]|nr:hypothetical protein [Phycisphaerales bacterium]